MYYQTQIYIFFFFFFKCRACFQAWTTVSTSSLKPSLSDAILKSCSGSNPVQALKFRSHERFFLPILLFPSILPCMITWSVLYLGPRDTCPKYSNFLFIICRSSLFLCSWRSTFWVVSYNIVVLFCETYLEILLTFYWKCFTLNRVFKNLVRLTARQAG